MSQINSNTKDDFQVVLLLSCFVGHPVRSSVLVVFYNFLLIDATDRSKIRSDQKRFFIALSLYPLSCFANTPFNNIHYNDIHRYKKSDEQIHLIKLLI